MPFQSEKQRRYLWANEPEIARDWTDTYGSGIARALGGRIGFFEGAQADTASGKSMSPGTSASGGQRGGGGGGPHGEGAWSGPSYSPPKTVTYTGPKVHGEGTGTQTFNKNLRTLALQNKYRQGALQRAHPGGGGIKNFLGNWASAVGGSQLGGGLGSMLFGPWGMLLGSLFGQGVGRRAWKAGQTDEKETMRDILFGNPNTKSTLLSNLFNKQPRDGGIQGIKGIETIDIRDKFNRKGDDFSEIEGQQAKLKGLALAQYRVLQKKQAYEPYGGEKMTPKDKQFLNRLEEMMKEEKMYSLPLIG
jgi:hypothetical protein